MRSVTRRRFLRDLTRCATGLGLLPLLVACGQAEPQPTPARIDARAPSDGTSGGSPTAQTSPTYVNPWITPAPTPPAYATPLPTGIATRPNSTRPPTLTLPPIPTRSIPTPTPTFGPGDPYNIGIHGAGSYGAGLATQHSELIALGTVLEVLPARWSTPDGTRPPNPHQQPPPASIFRPVIFQSTQILKGQAPEPILYLCAGGGRVGADSVTYSGNNNYSFEVGEQCVLFLSPLRPTLRVNDQALFNIDEHFTILPDGQATNGFERMTLQQLLDKVAAVLNTPRSSP